MLQCKWKPSSECDYDIDKDKNQLKKATRENEYDFLTNHDFESPEKRILCKKLKTFCYKYTGNIQEIYRKYTVNIQ